MTQVETYLKTTKAAKLLGVSPKALRTHYKAWGIRRKGSGRSLYFCIADIQKTAQQIHPPWPTYTVEQALIVLGLTSDKSFKQMVGRGFVDHFVDIRGAIHVRKAHIDFALSTYDGYYYKWKNLRERFGE